MKFILASLILLSSTLSWSQKGFDVIRQAEKKIEKGKFDKALKLLDQADTMNYGFCGNAWFETKESIALNRAKIFDSMEEPLKAAITLNNCSFFFNTEIDSIKTAYFINEFGKELVKREIDSCIEALTYADIDSMGIWMEIKLKVNFSEKPFILSYGTVDATLQDMNRNVEKHQDKGFLDRFKIALHRKPFYRLLEE